MFESTYYDLIKSLKWKYWTVRLIKLKSTTSSSHACFLILLQLARSVTAYFDTARKTNLTKLPMAATLFQRNFRVYEAADGSTPFTAGVEFQGGQVLLVHRPTQRGLHFYQAGAAIAQLAQSDVEELLCEDRFVARGDVYGCLGLLSIPTGMFYSWNYTEEH